MFAALLKTDIITVIRKICKIQNLIIKEKLDS